MIVPKQQLIKKQANLRVDKLPPPITGQEVIHQDSDPPPILAQPDLERKNPHFSKTKKASSFNRYVFFFTVYPSSNSFHLICSLLAGLLCDKNTANKSLPL